MNKRIIVLVAFCISLVQPMVASMSFLKSYDTLLIPPLRDDRRIGFSVSASGGVHTLARFEEGNANSMRIWQCSQDGLAMLNGFPSTSAIGMLDSQIDATDNGVRGHYVPSGRLNLRFASNLVLQGRIHDGWTIGCYLPIYATELSDVHWVDQTQDLNAQDARVKEYLSQSLYAVAYTLGDGLDIGNWKRSGIGDLVGIVRWAHNYPQAKPFLKNVRLAFYLGLNFPTGKREDFDKLLAFSYGYDGSWAIPFGIGLALSLSDHIKIGADVQLTTIFGNTRTRRIKTAFAQTDLLLLQKAPVYRDAGLDQCFNLYAKLHNIYGCTFMLGYQYYKHGEDMYAIKGNAFSSVIANSAERLQDWTAHHCVASINYVYTGREPSAQWAIPELSAFVRAPFNGRRSIMYTTIGVVGTVHF